MGDKVTSVLASLVVLATVTTLVLPKRETPQVESSFFSGFAGTIRAALGQSK